MAEGRRFPSVRAVVAAACLLVPLAGVVWWLYRPKPDTGVPGPALSELEVVCLGRVDGLAHVAALEPALPGRVVVVTAKEGDVVAGGDELVRLDDTGYKLREDEARAAVTAADLELAGANLDIEQYPNKILGQNVALSAAAERVAAGRRMLEDRRKQQSFGTFTAADIAAFESEVKLIELAEGAEQLRKTDLVAAEAGLKLRIKAAAAKKAVADIAVRTAEQAVKDCVLRAPSAGTILRVQTAVGETASPGHPRAPILFRPEGPLVVRVDLEQEFLGRVAEGAKATIRDDTRLDTPTWTGKVLKVAKWVGQKRSIVLEPGILNDVRTVECVITIESPVNGLLVGQRMRVQIGRK